MKKITIGLLLAGLFYAAGAAAAVNVNTANAGAMVDLTGIGPVKAKAIVRDRKQNGKYTDLKDLTRVDGIGARTVQKIGSEATVGTTAEKTAK